LIKGIDPPFDPVILSYKRGDTGEGAPIFKGEGVCQTIEGGHIVIHTPP